MQKIEVPLILEDEQLVPHYASLEAAGADVHSSSKTPLEIAPNQSLLVPTGIKLAIPEGYEIQVRPRSGLALKHQITVLNSPGTIDSDYRGELGVILINHGQKPFVVTYGMRIAQLVLAPVCHAVFTLQPLLEATVRGEGGFGHTGTH